MIAFPRRYWVCQQIPDAAHAARAIAVLIALSLYGHFGTFISIGTQVSAAENLGKNAPMVERLPSLSSEAAAPVQGDWLISPVKRQAGVFRGANEHEITLDNGLIRRTFRIAPNGATVGFDNLMKGTSVIRGVKPEAQLTLDGQLYDIGGLAGQPEYAYLLPEWIDQLTNVPGRFQYAGFDTGKIQAQFEWKHKRHAGNPVWPPPGAEVTFHYEAPTSELSGLTVDVHYALYDGLPLLAKWLTIHNGLSRPVRLNSFTGEILAAVEVESNVDGRDLKEWRLPALYVQSEFGLGAVATNSTTAWLPDPQYLSQVHYNRQMPAMVVSRPPIGPDVDIKPGGDFTTFRTYVLVHDSDQRERQGLAIRRMFRTIAPWVTENPIMMHVRSANTKVFRAAVDQCAEVGFEMIIYTFGSGLDMENEDPAYLAKVKADIDYAHDKRIEVGAYSLLASRRVDDENDVINPLTGKTGGAIFGNSPCLGSRWAQEYFRKIRNFMRQTGLDLLEHDGNYPGDVCASTHHPGHHGLLDSQWTQWRTIADFYQECRAQGVFLNVPDNYFWSGSSKTGMGYRESNWSLPRERQIILGRQNIFDGTWEKTPSMGWMFVPLVEYQGGGAAATIEPLSQHLDTYAAHLANNLGAGVQACYRGPRLYDTDQTRVVVRKWVSWFKEYRDILESDIIHVRRADGRDIDCLLHVNPQLKRKGLAMVYNPLDQPRKTTLTLPLYYTGLTNSAMIREQTGQPERYQLDRQYNIKLPIQMPARSVTWFVVE